MGQTDAQPLLEREQELTAIEQLLGRADGEGGLALILGEPGIGKTAVLDAARSLAAAEGLALLTARCTELEHGLPFGLVRQLIEPRLIACSPPEREELFADAAGLARPVFASVSGAPRPDADPGDEFGVLHGLYWLVGSLARTQPLLLAVDDVQWADAASLRFLRFLLRRVDGLPIFAIATLRTAADGDAADLLDEPHAVLLRPQPLTWGAVRTLLERRLGKRVEEEVAQACTRATGGVPLYLVSVLDDLPDGHLPQSFDALDSRAVSRSVRRRLDSMGTSADGLARAVAVLGDGAPLAHAALLAELEEHEARALARALRDGSILAPGEPLAFAHPVVRAAVYGSLEGTAAKMHARAAEILERSCTSGEEVALQLLSVTPGVHAAATAKLREAAAGALARGAPREAAAFLERALSEPMDLAERVSVLMSLGGAEFGAGHGQALAHLEEAREIAVDERQRTEVTLALARTLYAVGRPREAVELLHTQALAVGDGERELRSELEGELRAIADVDLAVRPRARELCGELAELDTEGIADAVRLANHAVARLMSGDSADRAAEYAQRALEAGGLERRAAGSLYFIAVYVLVNADRFAQAEAWIEPALESSRARGSAIGFALAATQRAVARARQGALAEAEADARAALDIARENRWPPVAMMAMIPLVEPLIGRGEPRLAYEAAAAAGLDLDELPTDTQGTVLREARGRLLIAAGETERGLADLLGTGARLREWGVVNPAPFAWRSGAALALAGAGERERARELLDEELAVARRWGSPRALGQALCAAGELAHGDTQLGLFGQAVDVLRDSGARLVLARALTHLGAALRRANRRSDARGPLREGLELARACGAEPLVHHAHTELWATGARPRTPLRTGLDALTPSELRVAHLAAAGESNPQIAQGLFVTVKTVEMHLTSVYRKLDIGGRGGLPGALGREPTGVAR